MTYLPGVFRIYGSAQPFAEERPSDALGNDSLAPHASRTADVDLWRKTKLEEVRPELEEMVIVVGDEIGVQLFGVVTGGVSVFISILLLHIVVTATHISILAATCNNIWRWT